MSYEEYEEEGEDKLATFLENFRRMQYMLNSIAYQSRHAMDSTQRQMMEFQRNAQRLQRRFRLVGMRFGLVPRYPRYHSR